MKLSKILLKDWIDLVDEELTENLIQQLDVMYKTSEIYPYKDKVFRVFQELKPDEVKFVLLAQD